MFFITGLPRSRTAWMAAFLTNGEVFCAHELMNGCHSRQEFYAKMEAVDGNSDCGLPLSNFQEVWDAPTVIIERIPNHEYLSNLSGLRVGFSELDERMEEICAYIGVRYDRQRHGLFSKMNIQLQEITGDPESLRIWLED